MTGLIKPLKPIFPLKYLHEPLLGFALAGGLIFMLYSLFGETERTPIDITEITISDLVATREQLLGRTLVSQEREELIEHFINNEMLVREAVSRGLHLQDPKIRKRLAEKMYFLMDQEISEPSKKALDAYYNAHSKDFMTPATLSFEHIFFKTYSNKLNTVLSDLNNNIESQNNQGDIFWLGRIMKYQTPDQIISVLGLKFYKSIIDLTENQWSQPIQSGRGWHLVRIIAHHEPQPLPPEVFKEKLLLNWKESQKEQLRDVYLSNLREQYVIQTPATKKVD